MAASSEEAIKLKQTLNQDDLQQKNQELSSSLKELTEKNVELQHQVEKARIEKENLLSAKSCVETEKKQVELELQEKVISERRLRDINTNTLNELALQRDALYTTQNELNKLRMNQVDKAIEIQHANMEKIQINSIKDKLQAELSTAESRLKTYDEKIRALQQEYNKLKEDAKSERNQLNGTIQQLKSEKYKTSDLIDELRAQLEDSRNRVLEAEAKCSQLHQQNDQLELNLGSVSQAYKELQDIYNQHDSNIHKQVASFEDKIAIITNEKEKLEQTKKELESELAEEKELRKIQFQNFTGSATTPADEDGRPPSALLKMIQAYQKLNRHPEDIFQDYFDLRQRYNAAIEKNTAASDSVDRMARRLNENENLFARLHRELQESRVSYADLDTKLKEAVAQREKSEQKHDRLENQVKDLQQEKSKLAASLSDTTYQLQHLLSEVQRRGEPIPLSLRETSSLLKDVEITPSLPHGQLIFNNVAELQDLNKELTNQVRQLNDKVKETTNEISEFQISRSSDIEVYKNALEECRKTVTELSDKTKSLQKRLDNTNVECENYKKLISQLGDSDVTSKFEQIQENQARQRKEMDITLNAYRTETASEINLLKQELEGSRQSDREAKKQLNEVSAIKRHLEQRVEKLTSSAREIEKELKTALAESLVLSDRMESYQTELTQTKHELDESRARVEVLGYENAELKVRVEATTTAYNDLKESIHKQSDEKSEMTNLLQAINARMDNLNNTGKENLQKSAETIATLTRELQHKRDALANAEKQIDCYKAIDTSGIQDKYKEATIEIRLLKTKITDIEKQLSEVNQERIIAQNKLMAAEEEIKKGTTTTTIDSIGSDKSCSEHLRSLAAAEDRVRALEADIDSYTAAMAESAKKADALAEEHDQFVKQTQTTIDNLLKRVEESTTAISTVQNEAEMAIAEYKALNEKATAAQQELVQDNKTLEETVKQLDADQLAKKEEIDKLQQIVEDKTTALADVETKLSAEVKMAKEQRQTINTLRADVSNLTFEISQYKATIAASFNRETSLKSELERKTSEERESEESWKQKFNDLEKQREKLSDSVSELVAKHAEWLVAQDKENGTERAEFNKAAEGVIGELREVNTILRLEKDASESNYQQEKSKLRRAESEMESVKSQLVTLQAEFNRLTEDNKELKRKELEASSSEKLAFDAFKSQNQTLLNENKTLRESKHVALAERAKMETEIAPLQLKISTLETQLDQSNQEVTVLTKSLKDWSGRSAKLLSKYNRVDPAEVDSVKAELEAAKVQLESLQAEKATVDATAETLQAQVKANEADRANLVQRANERGRLAMELKRKYTASEKQLNEIKEKLMEAEKKAQEANSDNTNIQALTKEKETLEAQVKEANEAKDVLKAELDKNADYEKKYSQILTKARQLQLEKNKLLKQIQDHKAATPAPITTPGEPSTSTQESAAKIAELEKTLVAVRKELSDKNIELTRLRAQYSMSQGKTNRLQKELDALKVASAAAAKPTEISVNAPEFKAIPPNLARNNSAPASPAIAHKAAPTIGLLKKAVTSALHTADLSTASPADAPTPQDTTATAEEVEEAVATPTEEAPAIEVSTPNVVTENDTAEPIITTPATTVDHEITEAEDIPVETTTASQETASPDADLLMEEDKPAEEVVNANEDVAVVVTEETTAPIEEEVPSTETEEAPVEVEVHELETEKAESPIAAAASVTVEEDVAVDSPVVFNEEEASEEAVEAELNEAVSGTKRDREEDEEGDISGIQSPTKKLHTNV